jgi:hypothetical protein
MDGRLSLDGLQACGKREISGEGFSMATILCKKCGKERPKRGAVCPHCGAGRALSLVYFIVACILFVGIVGLIGSAIILRYLKPVMEQIEKENAAPLSPSRLWKASPNQAIPDRVAPGGGRKSQALSM